MNPLCVSCMYCKYFSWFIVFEIGCDDLFYQFASELLAKVLTSTGPFHIFLTGKSDNHYSFSVFINYEFS